ncbi:MAG TPA: Tim44 domain-containing protein [Thioploca sp.]|nr:MAG: Tim44 domain-containing protein [Gammaproteobacteria bacterium]HDN26136.1 Tim44 domain-containing protein [Thioploca sp.]
MNKPIFQTLTIVSAILLIVVTVMEPAFAGPGGKIASAMFQTFWGKVLLVFLTILFLPLILYTLLREYLAHRRTLKDLRKLTKVNKQFDWLTVRDRITDCFYRVHAAWHKEDMAEASEWMTDWYWKNQQLVYLDQWAKDGLINHCRVKNITDIKPLFLAYRGNEQNAEGSIIVVSITANMEDYLAKRDTGKVVEGKKGYQEVETVWTFVLEKDQWIVANIEEDSLSLTYAQLANELPAYTDEYELQT